MAGSHSGATEEDGGGRLRSARRKTRKGVIASATTPSPENQQLTPPVQALARIKVSDGSGTGGPGGFGPIGGWVKFFDIPENKWTVRLIS